MTRLEIYRVPEAGSVTFSMRIPYIMNERLESLSKEVNMTKNKLINMMIEHGLENLVIKEYNYAIQKENKQSEDIEY